MMALRSVHPNRAGHRARAPAFCSVGTERQAKFYSSITILDAPNLSTNSVWPAGH